MMKTLQHLPQLPVLIRRNEPVEYLQFPDLLPAMHLRAELPHHLPQEV
jgi:hypothetical protein